MTSCDKCERNISKANFARHFRACGKKHVIEEEKKDRGGKLDSLESFSVSSESVKIGGFAGKIRDIDGAKPVVNLILAGVVAKLRDIKKKSKSIHSKV